MAVSGVTIVPATRKLDWATLGGLLAAIILIGAALALGGQAPAFYNTRAVLIVLGGTAAVTLIGHSWQDVRGLRKILARSLFHQMVAHDAMARQLIDIAILARSQGVLALERLLTKMRGEPFLQRAMALVADGTPPEQVDPLLQQEIEAGILRHQRGAGILRRAAEVAPAMGLIGTLVGLVQMLSQLENPAALGPAMAIALLTTFYGALLGTVLLSPLAEKLERRAHDEILIKQMIQQAALSICAQDNPRRLEMLLNALLPPAQRIRYFND